MIVCKATEKIYIAFRDEVIVLKKEVGYPAYDNLRYFINFFLFILDLLSRIKLILLI
jgi:hypothetical protein